MKKTQQKVIDILGQARVLVSESLAKYSSFHIGGPADLFFRAKTQEDLILAIKSAQDLGLPYFVIGGGTNLLIGDGGFRGLVIRNEAGNIRLLGIKGKKTVKSDGLGDSIQKVYLEVDSGVSINRLVRFTLDQGFGGLEFFLGQPGTVGGAVYINAHNMKKGQFFADRIVEAKILGKDGTVQALPVNYFRFGYDQSILQRTHEIVLSVVIELVRGDKLKLWQDGQATLDYRQTTQPNGVFSSGCTFRNIPKSEAVRLATPAFTISAGFLLETVGLKGTKKGKAMFSNHHANFIVHHGGARAADVLELIKLGKQKVKDRFNIDLREEIVLMGEF